jgi:hypothetical protein
MDLISIALNNPELINLNKSPDIIQATGISKLNFRSRNKQSDE